MKTSQKGLVTLAVSEGLVDTAYLDSKKIWTCGVGHTKAAGSPDPKEWINRHMTIREIMELFAVDVVKYEAMINRNVTVPLFQHEYDALVHFVYNVGEGNLKKSNLLRLLNSGNKTQAFNTGFHGFLKPPELKDRRDTERALAISGDYGSTMAPLYTADSSGKLKRLGTIDVARHLVNPTPPTSVTIKQIATESKLPVTATKQPFSFVDWLVNFFRY